MVLVGLFDEKDIANGTDKKAVKDLLIKYYSKSTYKYFNENC